MNGYFHRVHATTPTRLWINNPSGSDLEKAIQAGAINCTTNPSYCSKLLQSEPAYIKGVIKETVHRMPSASVDQVAIEVIKHVSKRILDRFFPLYQASNGKEGYVTIQDDPRKDYDTDHTVKAHLEFSKLGKNFMAKIPVIAGGCEAIEELVARDIPVAGSIIARKEYRVLKERNLPGTLLGGGARNLSHFTNFVGGDFHITINWSTAEELIQLDPPVEKRIDAPTPREVVEELSAKLPGFRRAYEEDGMQLEEFADFGPVMLFKTMFLNGYIRLLDEILDTFNH
jgi:hypothetical protein